MKKKLEREFSSGMLRAVEGDTPRNGPVSEQKEGLAVSGVWKSRTGLKGRIKQIRSEI